jgi:hypothetical protein
LASSFVHATQKRLLPSECSSYRNHNAYVPS